MVVIRLSALKFIRLLSMVLVLLGFLVCVPVFAPEDLTRMQLTSEISSPVIQLPAALCSYTAVSV